MDNLKGKLIVIDGTDGSGKATQTELLKQKLEQAGHAVETISFPQHGQPSAGPADEHLNGKYGDSKAVSPYVASIFFAVDRYAASFKINQWLKEGKIIISDRYVTANMGHQGGKINDANERQIFFKWLYNLEYEIFKIPKPDLNIILQVNTEISQELIDKKGYRDYVGGQKRDIYEADRDHLQAAEKVFLEIAANFPGFALIHCLKNNRLIGREEISELIRLEITKILK